MKVAKSTFYLGFVWVKLHPPKTASIPDYCLYFKRKRGYIYFYFLNFRLSLRPLSGSRKAPAALTDGVTGNTSDFGSEESRFEP